MCHENTKTRSETSMSFSCLRLSILRSPPSQHKGHKGHQGKTRWLFLCVHCVLRVRAHCYEQLKTAFRGFVAWWVPKPFFEGRSNSSFLSGAPAFSQGRV